MNHLGLFEANIEVVDFVKYYTPSLPFAGGNAFI